MFGDLCLDENLVDLKSRNILGEDHDLNLSYDDVDGDNITYSYVWLFDKEMGLKASEAQCIHLPKSK